MNSRTNLLTNRSMSYEGCDIFDRPLSCVSDTTTATRLAISSQLVFVSSWPRLVLHDRCTSYSGKPYTEFVRERILDHLNMTSTTFSPSKAARSGRLAQAWIASGRRIPFWISDEIVELNAGPGGVISSVVDMVSWKKLRMELEAYLCRIDKVAADAAERWCQPCHERDDYTTRDI